MNTVTTVGVTDTQEDLAALPAWLVQYSPGSAGYLQRNWNAGEDFECPAIDRFADEIRQDDVVLFWVSGTSKTAGIIGWGVASGGVQLLEHAKNYRDPDGPRELRNSMEVSLACVFDEPIITREELKLHPKFDNFDLFKMPNRPNAFTVTREQWAIILHRLEEVHGR